MCCLAHVSAAVQGAGGARVEVESEGWELVGEIVLPAADQPVPAVLLLNKAAGNRDAYELLARHLADRGIASLRLDLRGHGESTNRGQFVPGSESARSLIWNAEADVWAAHQFLRAYPGIDADRIGVVGASYSGEEMAEAGRRFQYAAAYVALSPGSFSDASIDAIDVSGVPWLFVASNNDEFLQDITVAVQARSEHVQVEILPGDAHATDLLDVHPDLPARLAVWLGHRLRAHE